MIARLQFIALLLAAALSLPIDAHPPIDAKVLEALVAQASEKVVEIRRMREIAAAHGLQLALYGGTSREIFHFVLHEIESRGSAEAVRQWLESPEEIHLMDWHHIQSDLDIMLIPMEGAPSEKDSPAFKKALEEEFPGNVFYRSLDITEPEAFFRRFPATSQPIEPFSNIPLTATGVLRLPQLDINLDGVAANLAQLGLEDFADGKLTFRLFGNKPSDVYGNFRQALRWIRYLAESPGYRIPSESAAAIRALLELVTTPPENKRRLLALLQEGNQELSGYEAARGLGGKLVEALEKLQLYSADSHTTHELLNEFGIVALAREAGIEKARILEPLPKSAEATTTAGARLGTLLKGRPPVLLHRTSLSAAQNVALGARWISTSHSIIGGKHTTNALGDGLYAAEKADALSYGDIYVELFMNPDAVQGVDFVTDGDYFAIKTENAFLKDANGKPRIPRLTRRRLLETFESQLLEGQSNETRPSFTESKSLVRALASLLTPDSNPKDAMVLGRIYGALKPDLQAIFSRALLDKPSVLRWAEKNLTSPLVHQLLRPVVLEALMERTQFHGDLMNSQRWATQLMEKVPAYQRLVAHAQNLARQNSSAWEKSVYEAGAALGLDAAAIAPCIPYFIDGMLNAPDRSEPAPAERLSRAFLKVFTQSQASVADEIYDALALHTDLLANPGMAEAYDEALRLALVEHRYDIKFNLAKLVRRSKMPFPAKWIPALIAELSVREPAIYALNQIITFGNVRSPAIKRLLLDQRADGFSGTLAPHVILALTAQEALTADEALALLKKAQYINFEKTPEAVAQLAKLFSREVLLRHFKEAPRTAAPVLVYQSLAAGEIRPELHAALTGTDWRSEWIQHGVYDPNHLPILFDCIHETNPSTAYTLVRAAAPLMQSLSVDRQLELLHSPKATRRAIAIQVASTTFPYSKGISDAVATRLAILVDDPDSGVRLAAAKSMAYLVRRTAFTGAAEALGRALHDPDAAVVEAAAESLRGVEKLPEEMEARLAHLLVTAHRETRRAAAAALSGQKHMRPGTLTAFRAALKNVHSADDAAMLSWTIAELPVDADERLKELLVLVENPVVQSDEKLRERLAERVRSVRTGKEWWAALTSTDSAVAASARHALQITARESALEFQRLVISLQDNDPSPDMLRTFFAGPNGPAATALWSGTVTEGRDLAVAWALADPPTSGVHQKARYLPMGDAGHRRPNRGVRVRKILRRRAEQTARVISVPIPRVTPPDAPERQFRA